jgi:hypothetical protein
MRKLLTLIMLALAGCSQKPEFDSWQEELAYLKSQSNPTVAQFKRREELAKTHAREIREQEEKADREALFKRMQEGGKSAPMTPPPSLHAQ